MKVGMSFLVSLILAVSVVSPGYARVTPEEAKKVIEEYICRK